jgi:phage protein D
MAQGDHPADGRGGAHAADRRPESGDRDQAKDRADSNAEEAKRAKGGGTVTLVGAPEAQAQGLCRISGVRSGIDGHYRVSEATHNFSRDGGWVTLCYLDASETEKK